MTRRLKAKKNKSGKEIEVDEDRSSRAMAIHEHIRRDGEKEMERDAMVSCSGQPLPQDFLWGHHSRRKGLSTCSVPGGFLLENLGYTFGFIISHHGPPAIIY